MSLNSMRPNYRPRPPKPAPPVKKAKTTVPQLIGGKSRQKVLKAIDYDASVPRCASCKHFRTEALMLFNSLPHFVPDRCRLHNIRVEKAGVCSTWAGHFGDVLDGTATSAPLTAPTPQA